MALTKEEYEFLMNLNLETASNEERLRAGQLAVRGVAENLINRFDQLEKKIDLLWEAHPELHKEAKSEKG